MLRKDKYNKQRSEKGRHQRNKKSNRISLHPIREREGQHGPITCALAKRTQKKLKNGAVAPFYKNTTSANKTNI